jgi:hypothetical protein
MVDCGLSPTMPGSARFFSILSAFQKVDFATFSDEKRTAIRKLTRGLDDRIRFSRTFDASAADMVVVRR